MEAFKNNKVVEVTTYRKRKGKLVKTHTRRLPKSPGEYIDLKGINVIRQRLGLKPTTRTGLMALRKRLAKKKEEIRKEQAKELKEAFENYK